jgi:hypothetical protein
MAYTLDDQIALLEDQIANYTGAVPYTGAPPSRAAVAHLPRPRSATLPSRPRGTTMSRPTMPSMSIPSFEQYSSSAAELAGLQQQKLQLEIMREQAQAQSRAMAEIQDLQRAIARGKAGLDSGIDFGGNRGQMAVFDGAFSATGDPTGARRVPMPFAQDAILAGATVVITQQPQYDWKGYAITVDPTVAPAFEIQDIEVGTQSIFPARAAFAATLPDPLDQLRFIETWWVPSRTDVSITVQNVSGAVSNFSALFYGWARAVQS